MDFIKQVIAGKKRLLTIDELLPYDVPKYLGFTVKQFYEIFKDDV